MGDNMITLYSTDCPKCNVLKNKLSERNIRFRINNDKDEMIKKGFTVAPILDVDGTIMNFMEAVKWINDGGDNN
jgi:glutaredoxin